MKGNNAPYDYLQKPSRRRFLGLSTGALATGVAGCIEDETEGPSQADTGSPEETTGTTERTETERREDTTSPPETTSPAHEFKSPPYDTIETEAGPSSTTISGHIVLEEGQYAQYNFELEEPTQIHITGFTEAEGRMDLFLLSPESELSTYMEGESADFSGGFSETNIESVDRSTEIPAGEYFLVFDNSAVYGAEPEGEVTFAFEMVLGDATPSQPKIREVQDNFGNTFRFSRDERDDVSVDEEIVVSDDTVVDLCVTEVAKQPEDDLVYTYWFGNTLSEHPDNADEIEANCNAWDMQRSDYQSDWGFTIWISNGDEIGYQNDGTDYRVDVRYTNLTLEE